MTRDAGRIHFGALALSAAVVVAVATIWLRDATTEFAARVRGATQSLEIATPRRVAILPPARARRIGDSLDLSRDSPAWPEGQADAQAFVEPDPATFPPLVGEAGILGNQAVIAANHGEFATAVADLEHALDLEPEHPLLLRNLQMTYLNWASVEIDGGELDTAVEILRLADEIAPHPLVLRALAVALLRSQRPAEAAASLEAALALVPNDGAMMAMLAQAYVELDRRPEALDLLLRAREAGVVDPGLDQLAARLSREVDAEWEYVRLDTAHFHIDASDDSDSALVAEIAVALEDAYDVVGALLDYFPEGRTRAVLYPQEDFHLVTRMPDWIGGLFDGRIKVPVRGLDSGDGDLTRVLRHEYAHRIISDLGGRACPVWLNEGVAMWAEGDAEFRRQWALGQISGRRLLDLTTIQGSLSTLPKSDAQLAYAQSYLAVEHLAARYGERSIAALLHQLEIDGDLQVAAGAVFRTDLRSLLLTFFEDLATAAVP